MTLEAELQNACFLTYGREKDVTLFRNNTGQAKTPICEREHLERLLSFLIQVRPGNVSAPVNECLELIRALLEEKQRYTRYGLAKGSSDCIGIVQTPRAGIFLAAEFKTVRGRVSLEQQMFLDLVNRRGGVGGVVRSVEEMGILIDRARAQ